MDFYPINKITLSCPICHTEVKFDVSSENDTEMQNLLSASEHLMCPICQTKFGGAQKLLEEVDTYNKFIVELKNYSKIFNVKFE